MFQEPRGVEWVRRRAAGDEVSEAVTGVRGWDRAVAGKPGATAKLWSGRAWLTLLLSDDHSSC